MQRYPNNIDYHKLWLQCSHRSILLSSHYYEVDNSMFKHSEQAITHIRGCRGDSNQYSILQGYKPDNTTRRSGGHHEWQPFMTQSKSRTGSYLTLVSSFTRMSRRTHRGCPDTILYNIHKEVGYRPTRRHAKLLSLGIPYVSYAPVHSMLVHQGLTDAGLNWHRRGLQP
jgi:hypothetical protein